MEGKSLTFYEVLGEEVITVLVDRFYAKVFTNPILAPLFESSKIDAVKEKQFSFLCQFLGGPMYYNERFGQPKMRMRHLPHAINNEAKEEWLQCMKSSIHETIADEKLADALYNCFPKLAQHMVNTP